MIRPLAAGAALLLLAAVPAAAHPAGAVLPGTSLADSPLVEVQNRGLRPVEIRRLLLDRGYRNLEFLDRSAPYRVEACRDGTLFELRVGAAGRIRDSRDIGQCGRSQRFGEQSRTLNELRRQGYTRIEVVREQRNATVFEACRGFQRQRIVVENDGDIRRATRVGTCLRQDEVIASRPTGGPAVSDRELREALRDRGYTRIEVVERGPNRVIVEACRNIRRFRLAVTADRQADIRRRQRVGWCEPPAASERVVVRRPVIDIDGRGALSPERCQDAFDILLEEGRILFDTGSTEVGRESYPLLRRIARVAGRCPRATVIVGGHTDSVGSAESNQELSEDRALAVVSLLRAEGVPRDSVSGIGYGEDRPVATNRTAAGRAENRRIEFLVEWDE